MQKYVKLDDVISLFCKIDCGANASSCTEECKDIKDFRDLSTIDLLNGSDIRFYIPKYETIPTALLLYVGDVLVRYERIHGGFRFYIDTKDEVKAMEIAEKITQQMKLEHDESQHGVSWRTLSLEILPQEERYKIDTIIDWKYRVRDSY